MDKARLFQNKFVVDRRCDVHECQLWLTKVVIKGKVEELEQCPECTKQSIARFETQLNREADNTNRLATYHSVFERESICAEKLTEKSLDTYQVYGRTDELALAFAKRLEQFYRSGKVGNTIITGPSGVGKSHLSYGLAKLMNDSFKNYGMSKSVMYVSVVSLFNRIEASFEADNGYSKAKMVDLLSRVDFLFLDDLGKESRKEHSPQKNEWRQSILFEILDNRRNTIFNTNLSSEEIKTLYRDGFGNGALSDRIFEGVKGNVFQYPEDCQSRRY